MATETTTTTSTGSSSIAFQAGGLRERTTQTQTHLHYYKDTEPLAVAASAPELSEHEQRVLRRSDDAPNVDRVAVRIRNIKGQEADYRIDMHGFTVAHLDSRLQYFGDDGELRRVYFPEVTELLRREIGAQHVFQYEWHVRSATLENSLKQDSTGAVDIKGPVRRVHIDESPATARKEFDYYLKPHEEPNRHLRGRPFAIYNVWKPLKTVRRDPLCLCDVRTLASEDLHSTKVCVPNLGEIENISLRAPRDAGRHGFVYVREQRLDQALVFRIFDSRIDGVVGDRKSHGVAHSSFADPGTEDQAARESIEVRNFCVF
ncbi:hypothetical protein LTR53_009915 [Teratosphaeriaceae sp. CCFEE 6253]|nr:hypothetical protein LTR53_009915 [Teratosphaeriaceae sp. CCFEE 6253]